MKTGSLVVAYLHSGQVAHSFHHSMRGLQVWDLTHEQRLVGFIAQQCGAGRITDGRNDAVRKFLATDGEWLAFVDSDMGFDPDAFDRLIDAADPVKRPIVGGLAFGQRRGGIGPHGSVRMEQFPTIYRWIDGGPIAGCAPIYDYQDNAVVECDATGAAFFIVHRSVLEALAETYPEPRRWFDEEVIKGQVFGEDLTFFGRCRSAGYPVFVHTGVKTSHHKEAYLTEETQPRQEDIPTYVVIPMQDGPESVRPLLDQLAEQDEYAGIILLADGSSNEAKAELAGLGIPRLTIADATGWNIHQMWNAGINESHRRAWPCNIAILSSDIKIGPGFLSGLAFALRRDPLLAAVSPNYDDRTGDADVQYVHDVCADRYDGTGGLAPFAFMMKSEGAYRFPEELQRRHGDDDMLAHILYAGSRAGIVLGITCEHISDRSQVADPDTQNLIAEDKAWLDAKWAPAPA